MADDRADDRAGDWRLPLALTMGDPAGVGPLITAHAWSRWRPGDRPFYLIAPKDVAFNILQSTPSVAPPSNHEPHAQPAATEQIGSPAQAAACLSAGRLPFYDIPGHAPHPGAPDPATAPAIIESIGVAVDHVKSGQAAAVVTNPISKGLLYQAGFRHPGHTEFLAELDAGPNGAPRPIMLLVGGDLRVALVTIHMPLVQAARAITQELIIETARILDADLRARFGFPAPRIGLCGLNPHAGEGGAIGREEIEIINPAAVRLRAEGVDISDARPGDTIFHEQREGRWDAVIAMYHDQGLIPVKTLDIWGGVNVTLGLSYIRTSPDHGTAYDAAAAGRARPESLIAALRLADEMASVAEGER